MGILPLSVDGWAGTTPVTKPGATDEGGSNGVLYPWRAAIEEKPGSGSLAGLRAET